MKKFPYRLHRSVLTWLALGAACVFSSWTTAADTVDAADKLNEVGTIEWMIADGACTGAVSAIKAGIAAKKPHIMLLAGTMFEEGLCMKANWDSAAAMYMLAQDAHEPNALERLVAGYARPGRDNGMALWWAARGEKRATLPVACIPDADPVTDPDGFNAALERMAPSVFQSCVYLVGVTHEIASQIRYPRIAAHHNVSGKYRMTFMPADGTVTWTMLDLDVGGSEYQMVRNLAKEELDDPRKIRNSLANYLKGKSNFALTRYPHPASGLPPAYVYMADFQFIGYERREPGDYDPLPTLGKLHIIDGYGPRGPDITRAKIDLKSCSEPSRPDGDPAPQRGATSHIRFDVDADGRVVDASIYEAGDDAELDEAARTALASCHFQPATQQGDPIRSWTVEHWSWRAMPYGKDVVYTLFDMAGCERPAYPLADVRAGHAGDVTLRLRIGADGKLRTAEVAKSSGFESLDKAALAAMSTCHFKAPLVHGAAVESWAQTVYTWSLR